MPILGNVERRRPKTDTWLTPKWVLGPLGEFDLDPCAAPDPQFWPTAKHHIVFPQDGLASKWTGRVWCNPPFSEIHPWAEKMAEHGNGVMIVPGRIETTWMHKFVWQKANGVFMFQGRVNYCDVTGKMITGVDFPSILVAYGDLNAVCLAVSGFRGRMLRLDWASADKLIRIEESPSPQ